MNIPNCRMHKDEGDARGKLYILLQVCFKFYRFSSTLSRLSFMCL